jgi:large subunit ribosomal protein L9
MDIILKEDIAKLGFKDDIVTVKTGYAINYLIPKGLAIAANESNKKILAENLKQRAHKAEKIKQDAQEIADKLVDVTVKIGAKVGASGKIFGSVNSIQVADGLKAQHNIEIDRKKISVVSEKIKEVGEFTATIDLHKEIKVEIKLDIVAE